ncbi:MAG: hypothetical protein WBM24_21870, partial [Candidatus Sulfotelmatobacter sp.]
GKTLGRPRAIVDAHEIAALRGQGLSWAKISAKLNVGEGTVYRAAVSAKIPLRQAAVSASKIAAD